jgi:hypothetical protein
MLQNMQKLNLLSFVQYRDLLSCINVGAELSNLTLHDQEKLGNYIEFSQFTDEHLKTTAEEMESKISTHDTKLRDFITKPEN